MDMKKEVVGIFWYIMFLQIQKQGCVHLSNAQKLKKKQKLAVSSHMLRKYGDENLRKQLSQRRQVN